MTEQIIQAKEEIKKNKALLINLSNETHTLRITPIGVFLLFQGIVVETGKLAEVMFKGAK